MSKTGFLKWAAPEKNSKNKYQILMLSKCGFIDKHLRDCRSNFSSGCLLTTKQIHFQGEQNFISVQLIISIKAL